MPPSLIRWLFRDKYLPLVFLPRITTTCTPLFEANCDLHKSKSTYLTGLDASRSHLLSYLCHYGPSFIDRELTTEGKQGMMAAIIGYVTTSFKKKIRIFQKYEVWLRILTWDKKWIYIVTHFVQKWSVKSNASPERICLAEKPSKKTGGAGSKNYGNTTARPVIFAASVSKYVFKKGRLTVAPERPLRA